MGKEEAFFFFPCSEECRGTSHFSNESRGNGARAAPVAWARRPDLEFGPFAPSGATASRTGAMGRGGGTGMRVPRCLQLCRQMCPLPVVMQLRRLGAATSAPSTQIPAALP